MADEVHIHVHFPVDELLSIERKLTQIMAQIDDLQSEFDQLNNATRTLLQDMHPAMNAMQERINQLVADDDVENSKLTGITSAMADLRGAVTGFTQDATPVADVPPEAEEPPVEPTPLPDETSPTEPPPGG